MLKNLLVVVCLVIASTSALPVAEAVCGSVAINVTGTADGVGTCDAATPVNCTTLRAAISRFNVDANAGHCTFTITLPPGTYPVTLAGTREDANADGDLDILDNSSFTRSLTITGNVTTDSFIDANGLGERVFDVVNDANLTLTLMNMTIENGAETSATFPQGGGILGRGAHLNLIDVDLRGNTANVGGGISTTGGTLSIIDSRVTANSVVTGVYSPAGAGVYVDGATTITNTTIDSNFDASLAQDADGGGIYVYLDASLVLTNTTIAYNQTAVAPGVDLNAPAGGAAFYNVTLASNSGSSNALEVFNTTVTLFDTLLARNSPGNCHTSGGTISSGNYNLDDDASCALAGANDMHVTSGLGTFDSTTAVSNHYPLLNTSPAIDAGNPAGCAGPVTTLGQDENGLFRYGYCDIGASEFPGACGDGLVQQSAGEVCDDGNTSDNDGCLGDCSAFEPDCNNSTFFYTTTPVTDGGGDCGNVTTPYSCTTLRVAIRQINADTRTNCNYVLSLPAGTYPLTLSGTHEDANVDGDLDFVNPNFSNSRFITVSGDSAATTIIDAAAINERVFDIPADGGLNITLTDMTLQNGNEADVAATPQGGAINNRGGATLALARVVISGSNAEEGGGVYSIGPFSMDTCTVTANTLTNYGFTNPEGVGLCLLGGAFITNSTIDHNTTAIGNAPGGGIYTEGATVIENSTIANNTAADGGAIKAFNAQVDLYSVTISGNTSIGTLAGGYSHYYGGAGTTSSTFVDTLIADNTPQNCLATGNGPGLVSNGFNLDSGTTCAFAHAGDLSNTPAHSVALADNGGGLQTIALLTTSAAIDAGDPAGCKGSTASLLTNDEIGNARYGHCDIGAFEFQGRCGDGFLQASAGEQCDDSNNNDGDGCSSTCQIEASTTGGSSGGSTGSVAGTTGGSSAGASSTGASSTGGSTGASTGVTTAGGATTGGAAATTGGSAGVTPPVTTTKAAKGGCSGSGAPWLAFVLVPLLLRSWRRRR